MRVVFPEEPENGTNTTVRKMDVKNAFTLKGLLGIVRRGVENAVPFPVWVFAEIADIKQRASGHCYLELVENSDSGAEARAQAVIWSQAYRMIAPYFHSETGRSLEPGMKILVKVQVSYSELYSLNLSIVDIEPSYSVGEAELEKRRTIRRLEEEGISDMNKSLSLPLLPRRFAIVSSETSAGYADFMKHLHGNRYGFRFVTELFPAVMQGKEAPRSIVAAMDAVAGREGDFDALVLIRGGGSNSALSCFDDYDLAANIAQFPLPVLSGVGHDKDVHVCDLVSAYSVKTPTALSDMIIDIFVSEDMKLESYSAAMKQAVRMKFVSLSSRLDLLEQRLRASDPKNVLKRGYVLLLDGQGRRFSSVAGREEGDRIEVLLADGSLHCRVEAVGRDKNDIEEEK